MKKIVKQQIDSLLSLIFDAHKEIRNLLETGNIADAQQVLADCQECAIAIGDSISEAEGDDHPTIDVLSKYCEKIYNVHEEIGSGDNLNSRTVYDNLTKIYQLVERSINHDIKVNKEAVFFPYKASMWDSLESVWQAADADSECDAYVVPIPYYDRDTDGSFKERHYEGLKFPNDVPITHYQQYDLEEHKPDMVFIHNPYDGGNLVTSVDPAYYSDKLKEHTKCLVYIPYYATAGGMSEGQAWCPAYENADYIVVQSEKYIKFFHPSIPKKKFLTLGSPKFDSVIRKCQNPPEVPAEWKDKMEGKRVYFYNTSLGGMLGNTETFLKKMEYVFDTFRKHPESCLLWRPHPLFESTLDSMRPMFKEWYLQLKERYIIEDIGIYDTTPAIETAVALSDVYLGDTATSVTSLFGVAGKPLFLLNKAFDKEPEAESWKYEIFQTPFATMDGKWQNKYCITMGNKLFYSPNDDWNYRFMCDLSEYYAGSYYSRAVEYGGKVFVFPLNGQNILEIDPIKSQIKTIELKNEVERDGAFLWPIVWGEYAFLIPNRYPELIRFNMRTGRIDAISGVGSFNIAQVGDERIPAAIWIHRNELCLLNADGTQYLAIDMDSLKFEVRMSPIGRLMIFGVCEKNAPDICWLIPYTGTVITKWDMSTGQIANYDLAVSGIASFDRRFRGLGERYFFSNLAFCENRIIFAPNWGNKFVELDKNTGRVSEWESPFSTAFDDEDVYCPNWGVGSFVWKLDRPDDVYFFSSMSRKYYHIDIERRGYREVIQSFDESEIRNMVVGYGKESQWMQYACNEDSFNSLSMLLEDRLLGEKFDSESAVKGFSVINASPEGDCGNRVYGFVKDKLGK